MPQPLSGPGLGLQLPQNLVPSELNNAPYDIGSNRLALAGGESFVLPAGHWYVNLGMYCILQYLDPITGVWSMGTAPGWQGGILPIQSDGFTTRVANMLGCPVSAVLVAPGSAYVQGSTTITPTPGNGSTWLPIVGGALALSGGTLTSNGAGFGVAPLAFIPPPPPAGQNANGVGGVPATGYCTIASGTVSGFTFTNPGAGYPAAPGPIVTVASPFDPNIATGITQATITFSLTNAGALTGALCTNSGAPLANPANFTLTVAGAGTSASLTANVLQTITTATVSGVGIGYGNATNVLLTTTGGAPVSGSISSNPDALHIAFRPRPAQISLATTGTGGTLAAQVGTIIDGGLFVSAPTANVVPQGIPTTIGTIALTMGNVPDVVTIQPAP